MRLTYMEKKLLKFVDLYGNPFFVGSLTTQKMVFINQKAIELFGVTMDDCDFGKIFDKSQQRIEEVISLMLSGNNKALIYNFWAITKTGKRILVDLQIGFFNEEKTEIFLDLIIQNDTRLEMALHQINYSPRAEAILNFDEQLSIVHCNERFLNVFDLSKELKQTFLENSLINGFLPEDRALLLNDIHNVLETSEVYSTEIKTYTATGEEHWYRLDLQKRDLDDNGTKLMCYMVNIEKAKETEIKLNSFSQYLDAIQKLTAESLFFVDVKNRVLRQQGAVALELDMPDEYPNYPESVFHLVHPDDLDKFKEFADNSLNGIESVVSLKIKTSSGEFSMYELHSMVVLDDNGDVFEIIGKITNT